jgi:DNA (cytosine-5)-methyltransferase 1
MRPGDSYPRAVELAAMRYNMARARYHNGHSLKRPHKKRFIPPYSTDSFDEKWRKLFPAKPSWTVTAHLARDCYSHIHYDSKQQRTITIREAARLQSFPDGFVFEGNMGDCFTQIGNAVPPLLAYGLARHIQSLLWRVQNNTRS